MAAKDSIHEEVINALKKDDWDVIDPLYISVPGTGLFIDAGADKFVIAEKKNMRIAVEIKSFAHASITHSFSEALGKYRLYLRALHQSETDNDRRLYIATSMQGYYRLMDIEFIRDTIGEENLSFIIVDINKEIIKKWID